MKKLLCSLAAMGLICVPCQGYCQSQYQDSTASHVVPNTDITQNAWDDFATISMDDFIQAIEEEYEASAIEYEQSYADIKDAIDRKWGTFKDSTATEWVNYTKDLSVRSSVNYEEGFVEIEVLLENGTEEARQKAVQQLQEQLLTVDATCLEKSGFSVMPSPEDDIDVEVKPNGVQETVIVETEPNPIEPENVAPVPAEPQAAAPEVTEPEAAKPVVEPSTAEAAPAQKAPQVLTMRSPLPPDRFQKAAQKYKKHVDGNASRFNIKSNVIFAIIQTESAFNPFARSHIPAYGLMQLVPSTGGKDAYRYVFKEDVKPSKEFLYDPENNILLGTAYLSLVKDVYFKGIQDADSAYIVSIAAYNTGPGNVARTLTGTKSLSKTVDAVNTMTSLEVYKALLKDLPHDETKDYVDKVLTRSATYRGI